MTFIEFWPYYLAGLRRVAVLAISCAGPVVAAAVIVAVATGRAGRMR